MNRLTALLSATGMLIGLPGCDLIRSVTNPADSQCASEATIGDVKQAIFDHLWSPDSRPDRNDPLSTVRKFRSAVDFEKPVVKHSDGHTVECTASLVVSGGRAAAFLPVPSGLRVAMRGSDRIVVDIDYTVQHDASTGEAIIRVDDAVSLAQMIYTSVLSASLPDDRSSAAEDIPEGSDRNYQGTGGSYPPLGSQDADRAAPPSTPDPADPQPADVAPEPMNLLDQVELTKGAGSDRTR